METYLELVPTDLIGVIFYNLNVDEDIKAFGIILLDILPKSFFRELFIIKYPLLYDTNFVKAIYDDIYLNSSDDPWLELFCILENIDRYNINYKEINVDHPIIFSKVKILNDYPILYEKIKNLESFDFDKFDKEVNDIRRYVEPKYYGNYGFPWGELYSILNEINKDKNEEGNIFMGVKFLTEIINQKNMIELLDIIFEDKRIINLIKNKISFEMVGFILTLHKKYKILEEYLLHKLFQ